MQPLLIAVYAVIALCAALTVAAWALALAGYRTSDPTRLARLRSWSWKPPVAIVLLGLPTSLSVLVLSFFAIADISAESKATALAQGISEAINCAASTVVLSIAAAIPFPLLGRRLRALRRAT